MALTRQLKQFKTLLTQKQQPTEQKNNDSLNAEIKAKWDLARKVYRVSSADDVEVRNQFVELAHEYARTFYTAFEATVVYKEVREISIVLPDNFAEDTAKTYQKLGYASPNNIEEIKIEMSTQDKIKIINLTLDACQEAYLKIPHRKMHLIWIKLDYV
jgi:hypothetical protein